MFQQLQLFIISLNEHLSEASVIDYKYIKMTGLQDFYKASSFTDPFQKQLLKVFCKKGVPKNLGNFTGKHLCWSLQGFF